MTDEDRIRRLVAILPRLSTSQLVAIENIILQFMRPFSYTKNPASELISDCVLQQPGAAAFFRARAVRPGTMNADPATGAL
jgi:hypothetical protein